MVQCNLEQQRQTQPLEAKTPQSLVNLPFLKVYQRIIYLSSIILCEIGVRILFQTIIYDKAKYHYEGDFPQELPMEQAFVHTGMFLGWIIDNNLFSDEFLEETEEEINKFKLRKMTGTQVYMFWDGVLSDDMLNDEGNQFAIDYFDFEKGLYLDDYDDVFLECDTLYQVQDTWENYFKLKEVIDIRYTEWKKLKNNG